MRKLVLATLLASAASWSTTALAESPDNMLVIGTNISAVRTLDPAGINARTASELVSSVYDNLVMTRPESIDKLEPMLATEWSVSEDGKTITLQLRDDATFSSGNPVTAEDAAWSIQRIIKLGQVGSTDIALWGFTPENVDQLVRAEGEHTLVIELPVEVNSDLVLYSLASSSLGIIDKTTAMANEANGDFGSAWLAANTAGSGPFVLSQLRPNNLVMYDAREDYWGGAPAMDRVAVMHIPESGNLRLQMEKGDVDVGHYVASGDLEAFEQNPDMVIDNVPGLGFYYIALNTKDPDLAKPEVRRAFQHAFDWESLQDNLMKYLGSPWQSMVPQGMIGAPEDGTARHDYDPELAKQLLADAGYPDGLSKTLNPSGSATLPIAEALQATAREAGINVNLVPGEFTPAFRERNFEVLVGNSGARLPDPFGVATQYAYNPDNSDEARLGSYYLWRVSQQSEELNQLVDQSMRETDPETRAGLFQRMDEIYAEMDPGLVIFFQRSDPYVMRSNVKGYAGHTTWSTRWHDVTKE
jgi:peptide/nickel transport system substrate-binding protein